jgi:enoyl-CoA hydratase/carnithine racemase
MNSDSGDLVAYEQRDGVAFVTLQRPPQNRLTRPLFAQLENAARRAVADGARCLLLRGSGPDFCMGGDFREWPILTTHAARRERVGFSNGVLNMIESLSIPTITQVHGGAFGGGFELALHTDIIIAGESARFRFPEATLGVAPLAGGVQRVAERAGRAAAANLVLLSREVSAGEALRMGLVAEVVPDAQLAEAAEAHARALAQGPTRAHAVTKSIIAAWSAGGVRAADEAMIEHVSVLLATDDVQRGVAAAIPALEAGTPRAPMNFNGK